MCVKVTDTGMGINHQDLENLFKPFFKSNDAAKNEMNRNSHGLGLNICKRIVASMGGTLSVSSEVGVGTTFMIVLTTQSYDRIAELKKVSKQSLMQCFRLISQSGSLQGEGIRLKSRYRSSRSN